MTLTLTLNKTKLSAVAIAGGLAMGMLAATGTPVNAQPAPQPVSQGEPVPAWAPPKPAEVWAGQPVVWSSAWGGRWGVWINGGFIILTSNPVTGGG